MNEETVCGQLPFDYDETPDEGMILDFLERFLPPQCSRHRNVGNEVNYVTTTLRRIFLRYFNQSVERTVFFRVICQGNYAFFRRNEADFRDPMTEVPFLMDKDSEGERTEKLSGQEREYSRIHINVDGNVVRLFRTLTLPLSSHINEEKKARLDKLDTQLRVYVKRVSTL